MRARWWLILGAVVIVVAAGVIVWRQSDGSPAGGPASDHSAVVGAAGVVLAFDGITVRGAADVAPAGTRLTASRTADKPTGTGAQFATWVGDGLRLDLGGRQPATPLTVTMPLADFPGGDTVGVLVTKPSGTSDTVLIPATYSAQNRAVTAEVRHLSDFWAAFVPLAKFTDSIMSTLSQALGLTSARPSCAGAEAKTPDGSTLTLSGVKTEPGAAPAAWPCVTVENGMVVLTLTANTPLTWRVTSTPTAHHDTPTTTDLQKAVTLAAFRTLLTSKPNVEGLLVPGTSLTYRFPLTALPAQLEGDADPMTTVGMVLLFGIDLLLKTFGIDGGVLVRSSEVVTCVADAAQAADQSKPTQDSVAALIRAVFSCAGKIGETVLGVALVPVNIVLSLLGTAVGLLAGNIMGAVAEVLDIDQFTVKLQRAGTPTKVVNVVAARNGVPVDSYRTGAPGAAISDCRPSRAGVTPDIAACGSTAAGADVCWAAPDRRSLLCGTDPWKKELLAYPLQAPLPPTPAASPALPWALELADGSRCRLRNGGSWPGRADNYVGAYSCTNGPTEYVLSKPGDPVNRTSSTWTVLVGGLSADNRAFPPPQPVAVRTAYFAATG